MTTIVKRLTKGSPLTALEHDTNLDNLNNEKADIGATGANSDITSLSGLTTPLSVSQGGTGASTLTDGGVLLGSGTGAVTAMGVLADGEMIVGDGTTDPVAESGATLRSSIGVAIGTDVQAFSTHLDAVSAADKTDGNILVANGTTYVAEGGATARTSLGLGTAATQDVGVSNGNVIQADATGLPVIDGSQLTGLVTRLPYSNIITSTALTVETSYNDSAGTNTHTLPLLSGTTAGQEIHLYLSGTNRNVSINHHASDSAGAEIWEGVAVGDFVVLISTGSAWVVKSHYESHYCRVYVDADETVAQGASEQITSISETADIGGIWNTTNDEVDIPFDCWIDLHWLISTTGGGSRGSSAVAKIDTTFIRDLSLLNGTTGSDQNRVLSGRFSAASGEKLELWAQAHDTDGGGLTVHGDAAGDESFATIKLTRRYS